MRVLVVDDSSFMRKVISEMIDAAPGLEVVGRAKNGLEGVEMARSLGPDLITLDIEMPVLDGLGALRQIRIKCRDSAPSVLMCSSLTTEGSAAALRALRLGAADVIAKDPGSVGQKGASFRQELIGKLRTMGAERLRARRVDTAGAGEAAAVGPPVALTAEELRLDRIEAVVVGSSTGGPPVLEDIFSSLPKGFRAPIFVAQHMPAVFTRSLASRLDRRCGCGARLVCGRTPVDGGGVFIAEGGRHMRLVRGGGRVVADMSAEPTGAAYRPSVDVLFESAAAAYGDRLLAVQLTGMGDDGARGAGVVRAGGGRVIAQHESTCVVYGMPRVVVESGQADAVMTPRQIAHVLFSLCSAMPEAGSPARGGAARRSA